jgi:HlyD family secretion protein
MRPSKGAPALALLLGSALSACTHTTGATHPGPPPLAVVAVQAQRGDIATYLSLDGQIAPLLQSVLSSVQSGTVLAVYANEGDHVTQGKLLAKIDDSTLRAQLVQAQGQVAQAAANLHGQSLTDPITAQQVSGALTTAEQTLTQARNTLTSDVAAERNAKLVYDQNQQLLGQGYVSQTQTEQARATYVAAQAATASARNAVVSAQAALAIARRNTGQAQVQQQTTAAARGALTQAQGQVRLLQAEIAQTNIVAPFTGVVTQRLLDLGAFASPNQPVFQMSKIDHVYVNINVPDESLGYLTVGKPVQFTTSSVARKTYLGTIYDVNAIPTQGTLLYRARIVESNPGDLLRGGMLVNVLVKKEEHRGAIIVPRTAVVQTESGTFVFAVVGAPSSKDAGMPAQSVAKLVPVSLGIQTDTLAEVISPKITPGTTVITTRPDALQDKSLVAVTPGSPPSATHKTSY